MASNSIIGNKRAVDAQADDQPAAEEQELRPTVELETQAKVDTNHPDARPEGMTLAAEEKFLAREQEIARTRTRMDDRQDSDREARTRAVASEGSRQRRQAFERRAAAVDGWRDPDRPDPRETVTQDELATINQEAHRAAQDVQGRTRAALARHLAERIADGDSTMGAVVGVVEDAKRARGTVVPIGELEEVPRKEVSVEARLEELWEPSHSSIAQVGLLADESGQTRLTVWKRANQPWIEDGERVRILGAARNWYQGRVSLALTGRSTVQFPERGRWWVE